MAFSTARYYLYCNVLRTRLYSAVQYSTVNNSEGRRFVADCCSVCPELNMHCRDRWPKRGAAEERKGASVASLAPSFFSTGNTTQTYSVQYMYRQDCGPYSTARVSSWHLTGSPLVHRFLEVDRWNNSNGLSKPVRIKSWTASQTVTLLVSWSSRPRRVASPTVQ